VRQHSLRELTAQGGRRVTPARRGISGSCRQQLFRRRQRGPNQL